MSGAELPVGINVIISGVAAVLYVAVLISIPFRIKKNGRRTKSDDEKMFWLREIAIFVMSVVIIGLCAVLNFGTIGNVVLCGCGVMGSVIAARELYGKKESSSSSSAD